nr:alpha-isocomene synthase [Tanacetum cinerariifolium]
MIFLAKTFAMETILDDTYDAYDTYEELEIFTAAVHRLPVFCLKVSAFCPKTKLHFASRPSVFCSRTYWDLSQEDTQPPMLDRTDFASWQQRIRLYCRGKENGVNILKSIDEGPYKLGTLRETLAESTEGTPQFGQERPRVYSDLNSEEKDRYNADIRATNILLQRLPKDIYTLINHYTDAKYIWDNVEMLLDGSELTKEDRESQLYDDFEHFRQHKEESIHDYYVRNQATVQDGRVVVGNVQGRPNRGHGMNPQGGSAAGYGEVQNRVGNVNQGQARTDLALNVDNVFQAEDYDAFDSDVDEVPTAQTTFMANLSSADPITDEARPSYDSDIMSEVQDHNQYLDDTSAYHEEYVMHDSVQLAHGVDLHADYMSVSNMISYDQNQATVQDGRVVVENVQGRPNRGHGMNPQGGSAAGYEEVQNRVGNVNQGQARTVKCYNCNGTSHIARNCTQPKQPQNSKYFKDKMLLMQAQENRVALDSEQLLFLADVDEVPTAPTMFMANLSSADPITDEAGPSYDSDIMSEVQDHDQYLDDTSAYHEEYVMHDSVQLDHGVDLRADYMSVSNMIPYDHYVKDNEVPVLHSNASFVPNDTFMMI